MCYSRLNGVVHFVCWSKRNVWLWRISYTEHDHCNINSFARKWLSCCVTSRTWWRQVSWVFWAVTGVSFASSITRSPGVAWETPRHILWTPANRLLRQALTLGEVQFGTGKQHAIVCRTIETCSRSNASVVPPYVGPVKWRMTLIIRFTSSSDATCPDQDSELFKWTPRKRYQVTVGMTCPCSWIMNVVHVYVQMKELLIFRVQCSFRVSSRIGTSLQLQVVIAFASRPSAVPISTCRYHPYVWKI